MWRPSFTQLDYTRLGGAGFSPHGPRLWIALGLAAALLLVLWALLLRRKRSGLRMAIGLSALVLLPNTILVGSCLVQMSIVHPVWTVLLMLVPAISLVASFLAIAWVALFWRATQAHECGRCRHAMQESQSVCPECGWQRGRPRGVRQARMQAIAICGGLSAFISLLVLRVAIALPITWACWFTADLHTTPHQAVTPMGNGRSTSQSGVPAGVLAGEQVFGDVYQRMRLSDTVWDPHEYFCIGFMQNSAPGVRTTYELIMEDRAYYTPEVIGGLEARLADRAVEALPSMARAEAESLARLQAAFVRGLLAFDKVRGTWVSPWEPPIEWVHVTVYVMTPSFSLLFATAASGPLAVIAVAILLRRRRHHSA